MVCNSFCEHTAALLIPPHGLLHTVSCFCHDPRTKMPDAESFTHPDDSNVHERDAEGKDIMKCCADKRLHAEAKPIN